MYIPEPKTMYQKVFKLPPAKALVFNLETKKIEKISSYWKLNVNECQGKQRKESDLVDELRYLIKKSVLEQTIADVPVGTFLSGGEELSLMLDRYKQNKIINMKMWKKELGISNQYDDAWFLRKYYNNNFPPITRYQYIDLKTYLPGDILTKVDRVSMAVSLEVRIPFLSREIVEFSFGLSEEDRCRNGNLKYLLKKAYQEELGYEFLNRRKQGFVIPVKYYDGKVSLQERTIKKFGLTF